MLSPLWQEILYHHHSIYLHVKVAKTSNSLPPFGFSAFCKFATYAGFLSVGFLPSSYMKLYALTCTSIRVYWGNVKPLFPLNNVQSNTTSWLYIVEIKGVAGGGGGSYQARGDALIKAQTLITGQPPSAPHNKIMLSGPSGIWFQWRG